MNNNATGERKGLSQTGINLLVWLGICLLYSLISPLFSKDRPIKPILEYEKPAASGILLSEMETLSSQKAFSEDRKGARVHIICSIPSPTEEEGTYRYFPVSNLRTGETVYLISEEELPKGCQEIDCLVSGIYTYGTKAKKANCPVLYALSWEACDQSLFDIRAPIQSVAEPALELSRDGLHLTLDRIEYRGVLTRVCFSMENLSGKKLYLSGIDFSQEGEKGSVDLGGSLIDNHYSPPLKIQDYLRTGEGDKLPPMLVDPGGRFSAAFCILPLEPEEPFDFHIDFMVMNREYSSPEKETQHIELRLHYPEA